jgi:hypothetical protein
MEGREKGEKKKERNDMDLGKKLKKKKNSYQSLKEKSLKGKYIQMNI